MVVVDESLKQKVAEKLKTEPGVKILMLARELGVSEAEVLAAYPAELATPLDGDQAEAIIRDLKSLGRVHVIVNSGSAIMENFGKFGGFSNAGPFLNVNGQNLHMHIFINQIKSLFAVRKPFDEPEKQNVSIQLFNQEGVAAFKVFAHGAIPEPDVSLEAQVVAWQSIVDTYGVQ